ncbi:hypothetical protein K6Y31_17370 [Motilimonas cestriensis]|uniref:Uncharacterized protein n=1 Tax=Motilimonas cestriensis TaxID=2742685 RepID=A0ABS8WFU9_9GAMM|nr:hypothetical protein [Motilimonas cestriensis]MCE2596568.1 hypothetical protein [Motilimonas cestriensis]
MTIVDKYVREIQGGNLHKATELMLDIIASDPSGETKRSLDQKFAVAMTHRRERLQDNQLK